MRKTIVIALMICLILLVGCQPGGEAIAGAGQWKSANIQQGITLLQNNDLITTQTSGIKLWMRPDQVKNFYEKAGVWPSCNAPSAYSECRITWSLLRKYAIVTGKMQAYEPPSEMFYDTAYTEIQIKLDAITSISTINFVQPDGSSKSYKLTLINVEPATQYTAPGAKISVNGEVLDLLRPGNYASLTDSTIISVDKILEQNVAAPVVYVTVKLSEQAAGSTYGRITQPLQIASITTADGRNFPITENTIANVQTVTIKDPNGKQVTFIF